MPSAGRAPDITCNEWQTYRKLFFCGMESETLVILHSLAARLSVGALQNLALLLYRRSHNARNDGMRIFSRISNLVWALIEVNQAE